jgi:phage terminase large subunit-like protein
MNSADVMPYSILETTLLQNPYIPHLPTVRQLAFLELECLDALYGGAAGGGKSDALLMAALQFMSVPGYAALLLRRTFADLKMPGSLIDRSRDWLGDTEATWNAQENRWRFPEGSTLQFGYADHVGDEQRYRSTEFQFIGIDEGTQFVESQLRFLFSRLRRRVDIPVPLRYRVGSNPGGPGHDFIKARYIDPGLPGKCFIPAKVADNPHIDRAQYRQSLAELDPLTRDQLERGDWDAVAGGRFKAHWFGIARLDRDSSDYMNLYRDGEVVERFNWKRCTKFQTCDPAASTSAEADYFVLMTWMLTPRANVVALGCHRDKHEIPEQVEWCQYLYKRWKPAFVAVEELMNQRSLAQVLRRSTNPHMVVRSVTPGGRRKLEHALGAIVLAESGRIYLPDQDPEFPREVVLSELTRFTGVEGQDANDDIVDNFSYMAEEMNTVVQPTGTKPMSVWTGSGTIKP